MNGIFLECPKCKERRKFQGQMQEPNAEGVIQVILVCTQCQAWAHGYYTTADLETRREKIVSLTTSMGVIRDDRLKRARMNDINFLREKVAKIHDALQARMKEEVAENATN